MPTGRQHYVIRRENGPSSRWDDPCRCTIGSDHAPDGMTVWDSDFERWDSEDGSARADPNCPACSGAGACKLCDDD